MTRSRRGLSVEDDASWIFNRMATVYDARPAYPSELIDALAALAGPPGSRIADLGAGTGHLTLPLAGRGFQLTAVEPARQMLARLGESASERALQVRAEHAAAEALPFENGSFDLVLIADALHFLDVELAAREIRRVLVPRGVLALVTCELSPTPFMRALVRLMEDSAPRRPRALAARAAQLFSIAHTEVREELSFRDETLLSQEKLERVLDSISFIGPAMNPVRTAAFRERVRALDLPVRWARTFRLTWGRRRRTAPLPSAQTGSSRV
ncbi:MAG TPA: class I SAM-dependent methyltransferase [Polyangiaceae bacterium]|nr:class I SAM-dependent methyltransferase [Polyangiaceae bacterium]